MYLTDYPWTLCCSNRQMRVIRKLLRGEELTKLEDEVAEKMSETIDKVYVSKMDKRQARQEQRSQRVSFDG